MVMVMVISETAGSTLGVDVLLGVGCEVFVESLKVA